MVILRIKAVSECMRIRRAAVTYSIYKDKEVSLLHCPHPLKKFNTITISGDTILYQDKKENLAYDKEVFFYRYSKVDTGSGLEEEVAALGAVLIELNLDCIDYYKIQSERNCILDQWNGEYEYLIGLYYEYEALDQEEANAWYQKALDKRFTFEIIE